MKTALTVLSIGISFLAGCNNEPFGMAIKLHPQKAMPEQQEVVIQSGRIDPSIPIASSVFAVGVPRVDSLEMPSQTQSCLSVAAC